MRVRYDFVVVGYVLMPEHVHPLLSEPEKAMLSTALQALADRDIAEAGQDLSTQWHPAWPLKFPM